MAPRSALVRGKGEPLTRAPAKRPPATPSPERRIRKLENDVARLDGEVQALLALLKPDPEEIQATATVFGVRVVLAPGSTADTIRARLAGLPPGLDAKACVDKLEQEKLLVRL